MRGEGAVGRLVAAFDARAGTVVAATASLALHLAIALILFRLPAPSETALELVEVTIEIGIETPNASTTSSPPAGRAPVEPGGGAPLENVDAIYHGGGGDLTGARAVVVLLPEDAVLTLQDSPLNALHHAQTQRIRTERDRASWEDRRATPNPGDLPFLASGDGRFPERRPLASIEPAPGARRADDPSAIGSLPGTDEPNGPNRAGSIAGANQRSPGEGIVGARGDRSSPRAPSAHGRPPVDRGPAATNAEVADRVRDDVDAELLAAQLVQSMVDATRRRGELDGDGRGGRSGPGEPGLGSDETSGGRSRATGRGGGSDSALDTSDRLYVQWLLELRRRVSNALTFPRERMVQMDQGITVVRLEVQRDGQTGEPELVRSSGFSDMDRAALAAIRSASPLPPPPADLAPHLAVLPVTMPIAFENPMIR